jgi:hypothetical protein
MVSPEPLVSPEPRPGSELSIWFRGHHVRRLIRYRPYCSKFKCGESDEDHDPDDGEAGRSHGCLLVVEVGFYVEFGRNPGRK